MPCKTTWKTGFFLLLACCACYYAVWKSQWSSTTPIPVTQTDKQHFSSPATLVPPTQYNTTAPLHITSPYCDIVRQTRLYSIPCQHTTPQPPLDFLLASTGRTGTTPLTKTLRWMGDTVGHNARGQYTTPHMQAAIAWRQTFAERSSCPYPDNTWRRRQLRSRPHSTQLFAQVIHLVREPLANIRSLWNMGHLDFETFASCYIQLSPSPIQNTLQQTLRFWVLWNSFLESFTSSRIRTEDVHGTTLHHLYPLTNRTTAQLDAYYHAQSQDSHPTRKPSQPFTWPQMAQIDFEYAVMAQHMARRYGYEISSEEWLAKQQQAVQSCGWNTDTKWECRLV